MFLPVVRRMKRSALPRERLRGAAFRNRLESEESLGVPVKLAGDGVVIKAASRPLFDGLLQTADRVAAVEDDAVTHPAVARADKLIGKGHVAAVEIIVRGQIDIGMQQADGKHAVKVRPGGVADEDFQIGEGLRHMLNMYRIGVGDVGTDKAADVEGQHHAEFIDELIHGIKTLVVAEHAGIQHAGLDADALEAPGVAAANIVETAFLQRVDAGKANEAIGILFNDVMYFGVVDLTGADAGIIRAAPHDHGLHDAGVIHFVQEFVHGAMSLRRNGLAEPLRSRNAFGGNGIPALENTGRKKALVRRTNAAVDNVTHNEPLQFKVFLKTIEITIISMWCR